MFDWGPPAWVSRRIAEIVRLWCRCQTMQPREAKEKLGVTDSFFGLSEAPGFIELNDGDFIVFVRNTILIASTQPLEWKRRIQRNFGKDKGVPSDEGVPSAGNAALAAPILNWPRRRLGQFTKHQSQLVVIIHWDEESAVHADMIEKMSSAIGAIKNKRVHERSPALEQSPHDCVRWTHQKRSRHYGR